jgi:hypothetical protein
VTIVVVLFQILLIHAKESMFFIVTVRFPRKQDLVQLSIIHVLALPLGVYDEGTNSIV